MNEATTLTAGAAEALAMHAANMAAFRARTASITCDACKQAKHVECATPGDAANKAKQLRKEWTVGGRLVCDWCQEARKLGGISFGEWRAMGKPKDFVQETRENVPFMRPRLPADFLGAFVDYVVQLTGDLSLTETRNRRRMHKLAPKVAAHHRDGRKSKTVEAFTRLALEATLCAYQLDELESLEGAALSGGDLCGNFDFRKRKTRAAFESFLDSKQWKRAAWEACGFAYDDLIAVQSPRARKIIEAGE
jgi:hypothetical protein